MATPSRLLILFIYLFSLPLFALTLEEKEQFIDSLAKPLTEEHTFYKFERETNSNSTNQVKPKPSDIKVSGKLDGAYRTVPKNENVKLKEIKIKKGTSFIDLTNTDIIAKLKEQSITPQEVIDLNKHNLIRYSDHYDLWSIHNSFNPVLENFNANSLSTNELLNIIYNVRHDRIEAYDSLKTDASEVIKTRLTNEPKLFTKFPYEDRIPAIQKSNSAKEIINLVKVDPNFVTQIVPSSDHAQRTIIEEFFKHKPTAEEIIEFSKTPMSMTNIRDYSSQVLGQNLTNSQFLQVMKNMREQFQRPTAAKTSYDYLLRKLTYDLKSLHLTPSETQELLSGINSLEINLNLRGNFIRASQSPNDFIEYLKMEKMNLTADEKNAYDLWLQKNMEQFISLNPNADETIELSKKFISPEAKISFYKSLLNKSNLSANELAKIYSYNFILQNETSRKNTQDFLIKYSTKLNKKGFSIEHFLSIDSSVSFREKLLHSELIKTPNDFLQLVSQQREGFSSTTLELDKFIKRHMKDFERLQPSSNERQVLNSLLNYSNKNFTLPNTCLQSILRKILNL